MSETGQAGGHEIVSVKTLHEGWGRYLLVSVRLPDGTEVKREVEDHGHAVCVLPYDPERRVAALVRQFRPPIFLSSGRDSVLEAPAGCLDEGEEPEACARREAFEEVGLRLGPLEPLGVGWSMPGISTEEMHVFLAPYSERDRRGEGGGLADEHENIEPVEIGLRELARMAAAGELPDTKTHLLVLTLQVRRPDLFV